MRFEDDLQSTPAPSLLLGPCGPRAPIFAQFLPIAAAALVALGLASCGGGGVKVAQEPDAATKQEARALFGRGGPAAIGPDGSTQAAPAVGAWTIILAAFRGEDRAAQAAATLAEVRTLYSLPQAYVEARGPNTVVAVGAFADPSAPEARAELDRLRGYQVRNEQPFAGAFLAPPFTVPLGSRPDYNLLMAKKAHGDEALYSLQVAAFGPDTMGKPSEAELKEMRKAAEDVTAALRQEGELAFYYHGPNRSMVTIGVFDSSDFDPQTPSYQSRRLMDARRKFPHNLYNGAGIRETRRGRAPRIQGSSLVAIPEQ